jgi:hypothetical protein
MEGASGKKDGHGTAQYLWSTWSPLPTQVQIKSKLSEPTHTPFSPQTQCLTNFYLSHFPGWPHSWPPGEQSLGMFCIGVKTHPPHGIYNENSLKPLSSFKNKLLFKTVIKANDPS